MYEPILGHSMKGKGLKLPRLTAHHGKEPSRTLGQNVDYNRPVSRDSLAEECVSNTSELWLQSHQLWRMIRKQLIRRSMEKDNASLASGAFHTRPSPRRGVLP